MAIILITLLLLPLAGNAPISISAASLYPEKLPFTVEPNTEMRGVWIASVFNLDFPSRPGLNAQQQRDELDAIVRYTKEAGLNAIFFQVRPTADALYDSGIFPTSRFLVENQGDPFDQGFDPLRYLIIAAHNEGIQVHAWINPFRITTGSASRPQHDLNALPINHPARMNPDWVVAYADGKLYFDPGRPEVRELITAGVREIVRNYDVDGIHFDDYFYPYPVHITVNGERVIAPFNDQATFARYGAGFSDIAAFRRHSVNQLIEMVYNAVKEENPDCRFGISPFGIWQNQSSNPAGSETAGMEAFHALHSDAVYWINAGIIDYIAPQLYWGFGREVARFDILTRWWSSVVDGTGVDLYIGHGVYRVLEPPDSLNFISPIEITRQIEFARQYMGVAGGIHFGFSAIRNNVGNIKAELARVYSDTPPVVYTAQPTGNPLAIVRPANNATFSGANENNVTLMGNSDPAFPVYHNGIRVPRTRSGFFTIFAPLANGRNEFVIWQNGNSLTHVVNRRNAAVRNANTAHTYPQMDSFRINVITPLHNIITDPGVRVPVRVEAPSGSTVTATLGGQTITLTPLTMPPNQGPFMTEVYSGTLTLPGMAVSGQPLRLGNIEYRAVRGNETATAAGAYVIVKDHHAHIAGYVNTDYSHLKIRPNSSFYDDYTPASRGMRDYVLWSSGAFYRLAFGGYVHQDRFTLLPPGEHLRENVISSATVRCVGEFTQIRLAATESVPIHAYMSGGVFRVIVFNTGPYNFTQMQMQANPLFTSVATAFDNANNNLRYTFNLRSHMNFYGFNIVYGNGEILINLRNPRRLPDGPRPLEGITIALDAGHGGTDPGALGFMGARGLNEKDLNLKVALAARDNLTALGANVVMIRETDITVDVLTQRLPILHATMPDLSISIHHNSMGDTTNNTFIRGFLGLYTDPSGVSLTHAMSNTIAYRLNRFERSPRHQRLAMNRDHRFPATLLEMGFLVNPEEYQMSIDPDVIRRSGIAIAEGVLEWYRRQAAFLD